MNEEISKLSELNNRLAQYRLTTDGKEYFLLEIIRDLHDSIIADKRKLPTLSQSELNSAISKLDRYLNNKKTT